MRRTLTLLATVAILIGLVAAPAAADKPIPIGFDEPVLDVNPCTGEEIDLYLTFQGYEHGHLVDDALWHLFLDVLVHEDNFVHQNNYVRSGAFTSGHTSDGYFLDHGREHWMINDNHKNRKLVVTFHSTWSNEAGSKFAVNGVWRWDFDKDENLFYPNIRCIRH